MKKLLNNLPFRLLLGIVIGIILGQVFPLSFMRVVVTLQYIMGQLITFCVPLIIIGFIAPSITKLGKNASRLLGVAVVIAYVSSICAAFMSTGAGYALIPHLSIDTEVAGLRELPGVVFELNIPQIMSVMSALVLSVLVGLAATWTNSKLTCDFLAEFQNIVLDIVSKIIIPILPFYIATTFCNLSYEGMITHQLPAFLQIIIIVMIGHYIWLTVLFCLLLGIFAIGAPGVPGGTVMASLGLITGVLMFDDAGTALMLAIFALQDSFGTACNVTGDGALTLMLTGYAEKHGIQENQNIESPIL